MRIASLRISHVPASEAGVAEETCQQRGSHLLLSIESGGSISWGGGAEASHQSTQALQGHDVQAPALRESVHLAPSPASKIRLAMN